MLAAAYAGTAASTVNAALQGWARAGGLSQLTVCPLEDRAAGAQVGGWPVESAGSVPMNAGGWYEPRPWASLSGHHAQSILVTGIWALTVH